MLCGWPHAQPPPQTYGHTQSISDGCKARLVASALACAERRMACVAYHHGMQTHMQPLPTY